MRAQQAPMPLQMAGSYWESQRQAMADSLGEKERALFEKRELTQAGKKGPKK
jgi:hypothetical protein